MRAVALRNGRKDITKTMRSSFLALVLSFLANHHAAMAHCWDRPSCTALVARYRASVADVLDDGRRGTSRRPSTSALLLGHFLSSLEQDMLPQLPDRGGAAASVDVRTDAVNYCADHGPYEFIPVHVGTVFPDSSVKLDLSKGSAGFEACYGTMEVSYSTRSPGGAAGGAAWGYVHFTRGLPRSLSCDDYYGVSTKFGSQTLDVSVAHSVVKKMRKFLLRCSPPRSRGVNNAHAQAH